MQNTAPTSLVEARNALLLHSTYLVLLTASTNLKLPKRICRLATMFAVGDPWTANRCHRLRLERAISQVTILKLMIVAVKPEEETGIMSTIDELNCDIANIHAAKVV